MNEVTQKVLKEQDFIPSVETFVKNVIKKAVDAGSKRKDRRRNVFDLADSTGVLQDEKGTNHLLTAVK